MSVRMEIRWRTTGTGNFPWRQVFVPARSCAAVAFCVLGALGGEPSPKNDATGVDFPRPAPRFLTMAGPQFERFLRQREAFADLPWFGVPNKMLAHSQRELYAMRDKARRAGDDAPLFVEVPERLVAFSGKWVVVNLDEHRALLPRLAQAFPHFPEINAVFFRNYTGHPELLDLLQAAGRLPHSLRISFAEGTLGKPEVEALARIASLQQLGLLDCRLAPGSFAKLAGAKNLEGITVRGDPAVGPECFVILAQLPRFRSFGLAQPDPTPFRRAIDEPTRLAIESLNGRLEEFVAEEVPTTVDASMVRALVKVKSLKNLSIDTIGPGLTIADLRQLESCRQLTHLNLPCGGNYFSDRQDQAKADAILLSAQRRAEERARQPAAGSAAGRNAAEKSP